MVRLQCLSIVLAGLVAPVFADIPAPPQRDCNFDGRARSMFANVDEANFPPNMKYVLASDPTSKPVEKPIDVVQPTDGICNDLTGTSGKAWHGRGGSKYNCGWYAKFNRCERYGDGFRNFGLVAQEACCVCEGGSTSRSRRRNVDGWTINTQQTEIEHNTAFLRRGTSSRVVLRRGQSFTITGDATRFGLESNNPGYKDIFALESRHVGGNNIIELPATLPVGRYSLLSKEGNHGTVVVLFNPWAQEDEVYMSDADERDEYIKAQTTRYFYGNIYGYPRSLSIGASSWKLNTGQILDDVLDLLEESFQSWERCSIFSDKWEIQDTSSSVIVSRSMSYMGGYADGKGVVIGRWDGEYADGKRPGYWSGTKQILDAWKKNNKGPVKYGQCWVFGCTLTSFMRTLGIPARVVTNFNSAHLSPIGRASSEGESVGRFTTPYRGELIYDYDFEEDRDSVWNFHVWVNVWMTRPDLDNLGHSNSIHGHGWNDIDSTPQEESDYKYQLGPANHLDMKENNPLGHQFDTRFVMGEYNANHPNGVEYIGRYTLTKKTEEADWCGRTVRITSPEDGTLTSCARDIAADTKPTEPSSPPNFQTTFGRTMENRRRDVEENEVPYFVEASGEVGKDIVISVHSLGFRDMTKVEAVNFILKSVEYNGDAVQSDQDIVLKKLSPVEKAPEVLKYSIPYKLYAAGIQHTMDFAITAEITDDHMTNIEKTGLTLDAQPVKVDVKDNTVSVFWPNKIYHKKITVSFNGPNGVFHETTFKKVRGTIETSQSFDCGSKDLDEKARDDEVVVTITSSSVGFEHAVGSAQLNCAPNY